MPRKPSKSADAPLPADPLRRPPASPDTDHDAETILHMDDSAPAAPREDEQDGPELPVGEPLDPAAHDQQLASLVVERGLATQSELDACIKRSHSFLGLAPRKPLADALIRQQTVTPNQLARLEAIIETNRTLRTIPGFRMISLLGKGTSASVFKARQLNLDRLVAIKVLPRKALWSPRLVEAFYAEGRAAAQLNHPAIVQAFDVGRCGDFHYFVMEFVQGRALYDLLMESPIAQERAIDIVIQIAEGLQHAHERGLLHRDVKPKNIILPGDKGDGPAKLADLGLARWLTDQDAALREKGRTLGTPYYISPEQVRGDLDITPATDIYALGATWYHMLTGVPPFGGASSREVLDKHLSEIPRPAHQRNPVIHPGVSEIVDRMLAKSPAQRYPDCRSLLDELRAWRSVYILARGEETKQGSRQG